MTHSPPRSVQRVRHELKSRLVTVLRTEQVSPHFVRVTFHSPDLHDFVSASFDDHLKFILPLPGQDEPAAPPPRGPEGGLPPPGPRPPMRDYTPRRFDTAACELDIEFALHGEGPAAEWAAQARPGQRARIGGPRGSFVVPLDHPWHLLVGDESALPAIARRLEELPAGVQAWVVVELGDLADQRAFTTRAGLQVQWLQRPLASPAGDYLSGLPEAVRTLALPAGAQRAEGYAWAAGEARTMAAVRQVLVEHHGLHKEQVRAAAYWKQGAVAHHENLQD